MFTQQVKVSDFVTPKIQLLCELGMIFPDIYHRARTAVDLLIPSMNVVVQYDGKRYHAMKIERKRSNTDAVQALGFRVVRIRERSLPEIGTTLRINERIDLSVHDIQGLLPLPRTVASSSTHDVGIDKRLAGSRFAAEEARIDLCSALLGPLPGKSLQDVYQKLLRNGTTKKAGSLPPSGTSNS